MGGNSYRLIQSGIQGKGDADPFIGVEDVLGRDRHPY